jgi:tetratricopeptide (TPR) repeat protein
MRNFRYNRVGMRWVLTGLVVAISLFTSVYCNAKEANSAAWIKANEAYSMGEWKRALSLYESIAKGGAVSAHLYYNMGNACYKMGDKGKAALYYEKALKLDPSDADAYNNLQIVQLRTLDKIEAIPEFILSEWVKDLRDTIHSNGWTWIGLSALFLTALLLLLYRFSQRTGIRKISFITACVTMFIVVVTFSFAASLKVRAMSSDTAIVLSHVSNIKSSPNVAGNNLFILHEGTKVTILEDIGPWKKIELADGRQGWIETNTIGII